MKENVKQKLSQTEMIPDCENPHWVATIDVDFFFEESHNFCIDVYDADDGTNLNNLAA